MSPSISVRFRWTADELEHGRHYHFRHSCRRIFRLGLHFIFALMLLAGVLGLVKEDAKALPAAFTLVGLYWFVLRRFDRRWTIRRKFSQRPDNNHEVEWHITPEIITVRTPNTYSELAWPSLFKVVVTPSGFLLYPNDQIFYWLPKHGFQNELSFSALSDLVKTKVNRVYFVT